jgi:hypothetical protein
VDMIPGFGLGVSAILSHGSLQQRRAVMGICKRAIWLLQCTVLGLVLVTNQLHP